MSFYGKLYGVGNYDNSLVFFENGEYYVLLKDNTKLSSSTTVAGLVANVNATNGLYTIKEHANLKYFLSFEVDTDDGGLEQAATLQRIYDQIQIIDPSIHLIDNIISKNTVYKQYQFDMNTYITNYSFENAFDLLIKNNKKTIKNILSEINIPYEDTSEKYLLNNTNNMSNYEYPVSFVIINSSTDIPDIEPSTLGAETQVEEPVTNLNADKIGDDQSQDMGRSEATGENDINNSTQREERIPGITNIFPNTYYPQKIEMGITAPIQSKQEIVNAIGAKPFIWYNVYQISYTDITYFMLSHNGICPTLKIIFYDSLGVMSDNAIPVDDTKIKVYIDPSADNLKAIFLEFKISNFSTNDGLYTITGVLDLNPLYLPEFKAYKNKTSFYALQDIMKELGLGFNSNLSDTDDQMTWINTGDKVYDFIDSIVNNSYKSDYSFMLGYIDYYYNFNYVDIEDELSRDITQEQAVTSFGLEDAANTDTQEDQIGSLMLSNDISLEGTNMFLDSYKIINNSTNVSLLEGYLTKTKYYNESDKELLVFDIDSITTEGGKIVMKSGDQDFYNKNINLVYNGKIDIDNAHKNFNYSTIQNDRNVTELTKLGLDAVLNNPNYNLYRFQKVKVMISAETATPAHALVNERLSGDWFIVDIKYEMIESNFYQKLLLVKRELEALPGEEYQSENSVYQDGEGGDNPNELNNTDVANFSSSAKSSITEKTRYSEKIKPILAAFDYWKITNKYYKRAILANIKKECNLVPQYENLEGWAKTDNDRIRQYFGRRVRNYTDAQLTVLKKNTPKFTEVIYGVDSGMGLGNDKVGDAWKYRGAGYIQITGKANMRKYGKFANVDLVADPSILITDAYKSAIVAVGFVAKGIKNGNFSSQQSANRMVTQVIGGAGLNLNAGAGAELLAKVDKYSAEFNNVV